MLAGMSDNSVQDFYSVSSTNTRGGQFKSESEGRVGGLGLLLP